MLTLFVLLVIFFVNSTIADVNTACSMVGTYCVDVGEVGCTGCYENVTAAIDQLSVDSGASGHLGGKRILLIGNLDGSIATLVDNVHIMGLSPNDSVSDIIEVYLEHTIVWESTDDYILKFSGGSKDWVVRKGDGELTFRGTATGPAMSVFEVDYAGSGAITLGPFMVTTNGASAERIADVTFNMDMNTGSVMFTGLEVGANHFTDSLFRVNQADPNPNPSTDVFVIEKSEFTSDAIPTGKFLLENKQPNFVFRQNYIDQAASIPGFINMTCNEGQIGGKIENNVFKAALISACFESRVHNTSNVALNRTLFISNNAFLIPNATVILLLDSVFPTSVYIEMRNNLVKTAGCFLLAEALDNLDCLGDATFNRFDTGCAESGDVNSTSCALDMGVTNEWATIAWMESTYTKPFPFYKLDTDIAGTDVGTPAVDARGLSRVAPFSMGPYETLCTKGTGLCGIEDGYGSCAGTDNCACVDASGADCQCLDEKRYTESPVDELKCVCMDNFYQKGGYCGCSNATDYWYFDGTDCQCNATFEAVGDQCVCPARKVNSGHRCVCDASKFWVTSGSTCACDSEKKFVLSGDICTCETGHDYNEKNGKCEKEESGLSAAAIAGIAIGCVVGCAACCAVCIIICFIFVVILIEVIKQVKHSKHLPFLGMLSGGGKDSGNESIHDDGERGVSNEVDNASEEDSEDEEDRKKSDESGEGDTSDEDSD